MRMGGPAWAMMFMNHPHSPYAKMFPRAMTKNMRAQKSPRAVISSPVREKASIVRENTIASPG